MTRNLLAPLLALTVVLMLWPAPALAQGKARLKLTVKETSLGRLGAAGETRSMAVSRDGNNVAILKKKGDKYVVVVNGKEGREYEWILANSLVFTSDPARCAYIVQQESRMFVVLDGKEGKKYHEIVGGELYPAAAGGRLAYYARNDAKGKRFLVIDDEEGKEYDQVGNLAFSPDGKRVAYGVEAGGRQFFIIDGVPAREHEKVAGGSFVWSPDSKRYAYGAVKEGKVVVVIDGKEEAPCDEATRPVFSPDGQHIAYAVRNGTVWQLILDGRPVKEHERIFGDTVRFSPDSKRLAYMAGRRETVKRDGKDVVLERRFYVVDGEEMRAYDLLVPNAFVFSPDSRRTAYVGVKNNRLVVVIDGIEGREYDDVRLVQFSPDSRRLAYLARRDNRAYAVVDNAEGLGYQSVGNLIFSSDGKRMAYVAARDKSAFIVVDGAEGRNYTNVIAETIAFSPDAKYIVYQAQRDDRQFLVVDGEETKEFAGLVRGTGIVFDSPSSFHALVVRDNELFRMQVDIAAE